MEILDDLLLAIRRSDVKAIAKLVTRKGTLPVRLVRTTRTRVPHKTIRIGWQRSENSVMIMVERKVESSLVSLERRVKIKAKRNHAEPLTSERGIVVTAQNVTSLMTRD